MHHEGALRLFNAAKLNRCRMITSRLAVMEAIAAVRRRRQARTCACRGAVRRWRARKCARGRGRAELLEFIKAVKSMHGLRVVDIGRPLCFAILQSKALKHKGRIIAPAAAGKYRHRGVGACDWLHFWLAMCAGAGMICTTDAAFVDIAGSDDKFGHIQVQPASGPLIGHLAGAGAV